MLKPRYLLGFVGHRSGFDEPAVRRALAEIMDALRKEAAALGGDVELYTGIAEGADTVCVEVARSLKIPVHLLLPMEAGDFAKDFSSPAAWERSRTQLELALQLPGRDSAHAVPGETSRPECYFNQSMHMLDAVDILLAVWDGQPAKGLGGTEQVVSHARRIGKRVLLINPQSGAVEWPPHSAGPLFPRDPVLAELNQLAAEARPSSAQEAQTPDELQTVLDDIAMAEAAKFRPTSVRITVLNGCAALLAALVTFRGREDAIWDNTKWALILLELVLVTFALWMSFRLRRRHIRQRWIRCRFACELVRGLRSSVPILNPLHPAISRHEPEWTRFVLSAGLLVLRHQDTASMQALRDRYVEVRLSASHPDGQIRHYLKMQPKALRWWNFNGHISNWSAMLAPGFVLLSLFNKLSKNWWPPDGLEMERHFWLWLMVVFLPIALPLMAGVANSLRHALDAGRRKDRYPQMAARLGEIRTALTGMQTKSTIQIQVTRSEELLLDELLEWKLAIKKAGK